MDYEDDNKSTPSRGFRRKVSRLFGKNRDRSHDSRNDDRPQSGSYRPPTGGGNVNGGSPSRNAISSILPTKLTLTPGPLRPELKRYRGFSTSISNLFLDESVVCPSAACCGVLSSSRTEHLLHVRNQRRKMSSSEFKSPSRILGISLLLTIVGVAATFTIWGFDNSPQENYYIYYNGYENGGNYRKARGRALYNGNDIIDNENMGIMAEENAARQLYVPNVMRFKEYHDQFWKPVEILVEDIWYQNDDKINGEQKHEEQIFNATLHTSHGNEYQNQNQNQNETRQETKDEHEHISTTEINDENGHRNLLKKNIWKNQEIAKNIRIVFCVSFFLILGCFGRRRRLKTRFAVLKGRTQDDKVYYGSLRKKVDEPRRMIKYEGACSHTLCGCYAVDNLDDDGHLNDEDVEAYENMDCMNRAYAKFSAMCCGRMFKTWIQCFSVCALAQEARETRLLLPPKDQRLDYITHQPFAHYFKNIHMLRRNMKHFNGQRSGCGVHFGALSKLSRYILATFITATIIIILSEIFNPRVFFSWADAVVMLMTFAQSFVVLGESTWYLCM